MLLHMIYLSSKVQPSYQGDVGHYKLITMDIKMGDHLPKA